jgi:hypothetical protein
MIERLKYGIHKASNGSGRVYVDVPSGIWAKIGQSPVVSAHIAGLKGQRVAAIEVRGMSETNASRVLINDRRFGPMPPERKEKALSSLMLVLAGIHLVANNVEATDPLIVAHMAIKRQAKTGVLQPELGVWLPSAQGTKLELAGTEQMENAAANLRFGDSATIPHHVRAEVRRKEGVFTLHADHPTRGVSEMSAEHPDKSIVNRWVELRAHNMVTHEQQLICLAGAVAIASMNERIAD